MLCAQHALNNLLQSPLWTAHDLAEIARRLDGREDESLDEETRSKRRGRSGNYDDSGYFSVQVLDEALQHLSLRLTRWRSSSLTSLHPNPQNEEAFILNHDSHWFILRRFGRSPRRFYNLDSTIPKPTWIGPTFLSLQIGEAEKAGYSIFVLRPLDMVDEEGSRAQMKVGELLHHCEADEMAVSIGGSGGGASSSSYGLNGGASRRRPREDEDEEPRRRMRMSEESEDLAQGQRRVEAEMDEDEQLRRAIEASLLDDPPVVKGSKDVPVELGSSDDEYVSGGQEEDEEDEDEDDTYDLASESGFGFTAGNQTKSSAPPPVQPSASTSGGKNQPVKEETEEEALERAIRASLGQDIDAGASTSGSGSKDTGKKEEEVVEEEWDEPSPEELRRRRLARFG